MENQQEYHDPDYPAAPVRVKEEPSNLSEDEKIDKIKGVVRREFRNEIDVRENEIMLIDQRMSTSRRMLLRLRYALVTSYYCEQKLQLSGSQVQDEVAAQQEPRARAEVSSLLRDGQRRLHPSVRKLLGKQTADLDEILFRGRAPRNKSRKDYSAMVQSRNYTIAADTTKSLRPGAQADGEAPAAGAGAGAAREGGPRARPRAPAVRPAHVLTLDEANRNQTKCRFRLIIGNTSKYAPPASRADRSTHKWLLYVRGPSDRADLAHVVSRVTVRLHHSYAPHHTVHIDKPPFHISRRGWGEFPAKVELHFALPERNKPATVEHTIKLDRNYTGLQTLGSETIVDVWLYSTPEMLPYEYKEDMETAPEIVEIAPQSVQPKLEPTEPEAPEEIHTEHWLDFFSNTTELDVDEMIIKPVKKETENNLEDLIDTNVITREEIQTIDNIKEANIEFAPTIIKTEIDEIWTDSLNHKNVENLEELPNELLSNTCVPKKRIMKYMDPTTGKIYYLEMDRKLDLSKVQEIVINSKGNVKTAKISPIKSNGLKSVRKKKGGVSLLKPEVKSLLKSEANVNKEKCVVKMNYDHIENDHCYLGSQWTKSINFVDKPALPDLSRVSVEREEVVVKKERSLYECLCVNIARFTCVRVAVNYLLKNIPVISGEARDPDYLKSFPFVVETEERFWRLDFAKRRNIEWSRAKLINRLLTEHLPTQDPIWRTKQILIYSRLHGFYPIRTDTVHSAPVYDTWSSWTDMETSRPVESNIKELYPNPSSITTLSIFNSEDLTQNLSDSVEFVESDEEIEIVKCDLPVKVKKCGLPVSNSDLAVLPVGSEDDRLRFYYIERKCADLGIELRNEDVGSGYSYSAVHAVLLSAARSLAEELLRGALASRLRGASDPDLPSTWLGSSSRTCVSLEHVFAATQQARLRALSARDLGAKRRDTTFI